MKRFRIFNLMAVLLATTVTLSGCVKNEYDPTNPEPCPDESQITLLMGDQTEVETRVIAATTLERTISDAFVLVFDGLGNYVIGEEIDVTNQITSNGSKTPKIKLTIPIAPGYQVIVLTNTGVTTGLPSTITLATLNTLFDSKKWSINQAGALSGKGMPMYGKISSWASGTQCEMVRAVAKIEVKLADDIATNDVTGRFTNSNANLKYGIYNTIRTSVTDDIKGNIVNNGTISVPSGIVFTTSVTADNSMLTQYVLGTTVSGVTADRKTYYMPEYGSSVLARGTAVGVSDWHKDRPCVILHDGVKYYRLDLCKLDALKNKEYIDLRRNTFITLTIKKVQLEGYNTLAEALNNPGSNLDFDIMVDDERGAVITSNGEYALVLSNDAKLLFAHNGTYDVATVRYQLSSQYTPAEQPTTSISVAGTSASLFELFIADLDGSNELSLNDAPRTFSAIEKRIKVKVRDNTTTFKDAIYLRVGNIYDTVIVERRPMVAPDVYAGSMAATNSTETVWSENWAGVTVTNNGSDIDFVFPRQAITQTVRGSVFGAITSNGDAISDKKIAKKMDVEILRQGTDIREIVEFEPSYGQNAVFYLGKADADNFFKGDGWIDDPSWTAASPLNLEMPIHEFKVLANVKITAPNSDKIKFSPSSVGIDAWVNKTGADMTAAEREIFIPAGTLVKIYGYISTAGAFQLDWKVERVDDGAYYVVTVDNMGKRASFVAEQNFITGVNDALGLAHVVGDGVLDISRVESAGIVDTKANNTVLAQANPGHTEHDLGYKCDRLLTLDKNKELTYYYVTQTGFGYSLGTIKIAKIRPSEGGSTTEKDWGYYIPSGNTTLDNKYTTQIGNELLFVVGRSDALEISNNVIGASWDSWLVGNHTWSTTMDYCTNGAVSDDPNPSTEVTSVHQRGPVGTYGWPNNNGLYPMENKPYFHHPFGGTDDPCAYVFPRGYWRAPSEAEVESWATTYKYPHIPSYAQGIAVKFGSNPIEYITAPYYLTNNGLYALSNDTKSRAVKLGKLLYVYRIPNSHTGPAANCMYPLIHNNGANSAPAEFIGEVSEFRRTVAEFCIRD